jgi:hypothetical protein
MSSIFKENTSENALLIHIIRFTLAFTMIC